MARVSNRVVFWPKPALWRILRAGYSPQGLQRDLASGLTVGVVALPLAMAFAIATGAPPERGLFTAMVAGFFISALGGSRYQIGGPTGAFVVIISSVMAAHGYQGLVAATLLAGGMLAVMGLLGMGRLLQFIPYPVTTGFTAGIGVIIAGSQLPDFFGLALEPGGGFLERLGVTLLSLPSLRPATLAVALVSMALILCIRRFAPRIPAPMAGVVGGTLLAQALATTGLETATIGSRFGGVPAVLPSFMGLDALGEALALVPTVVPEALTIALLAGIESLLSAVVADGMTGDRHDAATELVAQGAANVASVVFGGIPATGAIARTATNIRAGASSPVSGLVHSLSLGLFMVSLAPLASRIPLASLSAVLLVVAWDMSEPHRFVRLLAAPLSDVAVLLATFLLTVLVDLTVAVQVGVVLAALLFMRRMSELTDIRLAANGAPDGRDPGGESCPLPPGETVQVYQIDGPFFFGVANKFAARLDFVRHGLKVLVLDMRGAPSIDATGLHALETLLLRQRRHGVAVVVAGARPPVAQAMERMGLTRLLGEGGMAPDLASALEWARVFAQEGPATGAT